ncbi:MAG: flagellar basal-body rod protein FlgF [Rhodospirillaceae bacterium]|jgi:flagellar basal-body rod protein FlgF|nr:flagellar basal-body rod protein FlgF [Rhodospirillales bacterium]MBT3906600.1 flagellar basal-body rod protein FlgF [Rhodospirillaceae bacterium]MBT4702130.1 flagellar basal-body rod protein FlgF [Rhodospirillaceae bacterium]MBT5033200.1 flagellar basal-body rod protein FlgF [Rhodospirillaceae bacterium]MBT6219029.1 flagellar basal-body rod protein FlgF [Rhodospirillaceae bacterium]
MENTSLIALSKQSALNQKMAILANNLANMNTTGFKGEKVMFVEHVQQSKGGHAILGDKLAFVRDIATVRDLSEGPIKTTGNPLDLALQGDGYFVVQTDLGDRYSRNGHLRLDETGQLVNQQGLPVLAEGGPIVFSPQDTDIIIARDGTVSSENGEIGKLRIVDFENQQKLEVISDGLFSSEETPTPVENPGVIQGMLEGSNIKPIIEMSRLIETQRAYEGVRKFIDREDERLKGMVKELGRPV